MFVNCIIKGIVSVISNDPQLKDCNDSIYIGTLKRVV